MVEEVLRPCFGFWSFGFRVWGCKVLVRRPEPPMAMQEMITNNQQHTQSGVKFQCKLAARIEERGGAACRVNYETNEQQ